MSKDRENIPRAYMLMGSMRSMGYSFEAAIADVIDNSISANCKKVTLFFPATSIDNLAIGILDDGHGMTSSELFEAMRYGSDSEEERNENDLGRFGLGMKSASMSQCRILTVVSRCKGELSAFKWDYNYILEKKKWIVQELNKKEIQALPYIENFLEDKSDGTLVLWEDFDVIEKSSNGLTFDAIKALEKATANYLALIYHRFLDGKKLKIKVNKHLLKPLDPFLENNKKTTQRKEIIISSRDSSNIERQIKVKAFVLPYATDMTEDDIRNAGGAENFRTMQGFYIYRNMRLIIWGTWFNMRRNELTKNARIRVDIPNALDDIWGIDITKRTAKIPKNILNQLKKTVRDAMDIATKKQTHRGRKENIDSNISYIWNRMQGRNNNFYYELNKDNLLFKYVKEQIPSDYHTYLDMLLEEIEANIPTQQIYIDKCNDVVEVEEKDHRLDNLYQQGLTLIDTYIKLGMSTENAIKAILTSEPFCTKEELKEMFNKYYFENK